MSSRSSALVIGIGNRWAGDDALGLLVARALRGRVPPDVSVIEHEGEPTELLELWSGARLVVVVDALSGAGDAGSLHVFDASAAPLRSRAAARSTHAFTLAQAIELGRALGRLPERLVVVGVEGRAFTAGSARHPAVEEAIGAAAETVLGLVSANY